MVSLDDDDSDKDGRPVKRSRNQYKRVSNTAFSYQGKTLDEFPLHASDDEADEGVRVKKKTKKVNPVPSNPEEFASFFAKFVRENPGFDKFCKEERAQNAGKKQNQSAQESGRQICLKWQELSLEEKEEYMEEHEKKRYNQIQSRTVEEKAVKRKGGAISGTSIATIAATAATAVQPPTIVHSNTHGIVHNNLGNFLPPSNIPLSHHPISSLTYSTETPRTVRQNNALDAVDNAFATKSISVNTEYVNTYKEEYSKLYSKYTELQHDFRQIQDELDGKQQREQQLLEEVSDLRIEVKHCKRSMEQDEARYKRLLEEHEAERHKLQNSAQTPSRELGTLQAQLDRELDARRQQGLQLERQAAEIRQFREDHNEIMRRQQHEWERREEAQKSDFRRKEEDMRAQLVRAGQGEAKAVAAIRSLTERNKALVSAQEEVHDDVARVLNAFALLTGVSIDIDNRRPSVFECRAECTVQLPGGYPAPRFAVFELEIAPHSMVYRPRLLEPRLLGPGNDFLEEMTIELNQGPFFLKTLFTYLLDPLKYCNARVSTEQTQQYQPPISEEDRKKQRNKRK